MPTAVVTLTIMCGSFAIFTDCCTMSIPPTSYRKRKR